MYILNFNARLMKCTYLTTKYTLHTGTETVFKKGNGLKRYQLHISHSVYLNLLFYSYFCLRT